MGRGVVAESHGTANRHRWLEAVGPSVVPLPSHSDQHSRLSCQRWLISPYLFPIVLLIGSNVFMTTAWYWHLRYKEVPLWQVILISWGLAFFEYCLAVPANRYGSAGLFGGRPELKTIQEVITLSGVRRVLGGLSAPRRSPGTR